MNHCKVGPAGTGIVLVIGVGVSLLMMIKREGTVYAQEAKCVLRPFGCGGGGDPDPVIELSL